MKKERSKMDTYIANHLHIFNNLGNIVSTQDNYFVDGEVRYVIKNAGTGLCLFLSLMCHYRNRTL